MREVTAETTVASDISDYGEPPGDSVIAQPISDGHIGIGGPGAGKAYPVPCSERQTLHPVVLEQVGEAFEGDSVGGAGTGRGVLLGRLES